MANLLHIKGSRNKILNSFPNNRFGDDGDIVIVKIQGKGVYLCLKSNGTWYVSNKLEQLRKLEKTSIKDLKVNQLKAKNTTLTQNELDVPTGDLTLDVAGDIELNADGGDFTFKDGSTTVATLNDDGFTITNPGDSLSPTISIVNSGTDATDTPVLALKNTGGAESDLIGYILFQGINDAPASQSYSDIQCWCLSDDNSSDSEIGQLLFSVKTDGTNSLMNGLEIKGNANNTVQFYIGSTSNKLVSDASGNLTADFEGDIELNANGGDITFKDDSANLAALSSSGLTISNITEVGSDTDKILVSDSGVVKYVTGANLRSYIGAGTSSFGGALNDLSDVTYSSGDLTINSLDKIISGDLHFDSSGDITIDAAGANIHFKAHVNSLAEITEGLNTSSFIVYSTQDTGDYFAISTTTHGATTIKTLDDDAAAAHLTIDIDGHAEFDNPVGFDQFTPTYNASDTEVNFKTEGNKAFVTFGSGNITDLNLNLPATSGNFTLLLKQDGTGSRTVTNYKAFDSAGNAANGSATVKFAGGSNPTLTTDANHVDILSFYWDADNEICYGVASLDFQF